MNLPRSPYTPLGVKVVVLLDDKQEVTKNGILLTGSLKGGSKKGTIIAVGPGSLSPKGHPIPMQLKVGQRVAFGEFAGYSDLPLDPDNPRGKQVKLMEQSEVLGVLEPAPDKRLDCFIEGLRWLGMDEEELNALMEEHRKSPESFTKERLTDALGHRVATHLLGLLV